MSELRNPHAVLGALLKPQDSALLCSSLAVLCEWQRDWAPTETLGALAKVLVQHGGGSSIAFDREMQLLGSKAKAA